MDELRILGRQMDSVALDVLMVVLVARVEEGEFAQVEMIAHSCYPIPDGKGHKSPPHVE